jgi:mRNA interferase MazF
MPYMTSHKRGDIVLVNFMFSDESGLKRRPAVIISSKSFHEKRQEAIVCAITSNTERLLMGDYLIADWQAAGLLLPSIATPVIRTLKQSMIFSTLGQLSSVDMQSVDATLQEVLAL